MTRMLGRWLVNMACHLGRRDYLRLSVALIKIPENKNHSFVGRMLFTFAFFILLAMYSVAHHRSMVYP